MSARDITTVPMELQRWREAMPHTKAIVMVVEDELDERMLYAEVLRANGYGVVSCADGLDGLRRFSAVGDIDVVVLDLGLPNMSGQEFLRRLRMLEGGRRETPVVVVTGSKGSLPQGVVVLFKPLNEARLIQAIETALASAA